MESMVFTPWRAAEGLEDEQERLGLLFACMEDATNDAALFERALAAVMASRLEYGTGRALTRRSVEQAMQAFPTVAVPAVERILAAMGYDFDVRSMPVPPSPRKLRAAAKQARPPATRTRRHP